MTDEVKQEVKPELNKVDGILAGATDIKKDIPVEPVNDEEPEYLEPAAEVKENIEPASESAPETESDEFGNPVIKAKPKVYTEEEVNQMFRDRFGRGHAARQDEQKPVQQPAAGEQDDNWENQLKNVIKETVRETAHEEQKRRDHEREQRSQVEFEEKFVSGMKKYGDFETVVRGKPFDNEMMMATRSMKDPAAFIYAASKSFPNEIERISKIDDPYTRVAEVGRLEERMRKARSGTSSPRALPKVSGDIENRQNHRKSVDDLILKDAQKKFSSRRY